jgi:hypothetical protein
MIPNRKAKLLVDKYLMSIIFNIKQDINVDCINAAKKCALLCIDEIQEHAQMIEGEYEGYSSTHDYFKAVKEEIEKLD